MNAQTETVIEGGTVVAFDGSEHRVIKGGFVAFRGDRITAVGKTHRGTAGQRIDARNHIVIPGLISTHAHATVDPGSRLIVDAGRRDLWRSGFFNFEPRRGKGGPSFWRKADPVIGLRYGMAALLRNGATTIVELGGGDPGCDQQAVDLAGEVGIRAYYGPTFYSGHYWFDQQGRFFLEPDDRQGFDGLERAAAFVEKNNGAHGDRIRGLLVPSSFLRTPRKLFERTKELAAKLKVGISFHLAESLWEFQETVRNHGKTPVGVVADWGVLGPEVILGHVIYVGGHSQTAWPYKGDLEAIAASGATVAHAPLSFVRRGVSLESFQRYLDHGINVGLGTDTYPLDLFEEMRAASLACKVKENNFEAAHARDLFNAATLGGAKALGRTDLGRLAPGAKADIVLVDANNTKISPFNDPIRALVYCASGDHVDQVIVDGRTVVADGRVLAWNESEIIEAAWQSAETVWNSFPEYDRDDQTVDQRYPPSFRSWDGP